MRSGLPLTADILVTGGFRRYGPQAVSCPFPQSPERDWPFLPVPIGLHAARGTGMKLPRRNFLRLTAAAAGPAADGQTTIHLPMPAVMISKETRLSDEDGQLRTTFSTTVAR